MSPERREGAEAIRRMLVASAGALALVAGCPSSPPSSPCQSTTWYGDEDGDGAGADSLTLEACQAPVGYVNSSADCDDADASTYPGAPEVCDGRDNDCDGEVDEALSAVQVWHLDEDGDGFGAAAFPKEACEAPQGYVGDDADCDDTDADSWPGAPELCDGKDNDCDGEIDEGADGSRTWYLDEDGDGYGVAESTIEACRPPPGYAERDGDCDDHDARRHPGAQEVCNDGVDNDCDGTSNACVVWGELDLAEVDNVLLPDTASNWFGYAISCEGDTDGDGLDDLIVGEPARVSEQGRGAVHFFHGPIAGEVNAAHQGAIFWPEPSPTRAADVGRTLTFIGDTTGDGGDEVLLGSWLESLAGIYIVASPYPETNVVRSAFQWDRRGLLQSSFGASVARTGDLNGDGAADFMVQSPRENEAGDYPDYPSNIFIFHGNAAHTYGLGEAIQLVGRIPHDEAGQAMDGAGDVNGDGFLDLVIGAPKSDINGELSGLVYLVLGPVGEEGGALEEWSVLLSGEASGDRAGWSVAGAGDTNGDGYDDILIGAPFTDGGRGTVYLVPGPVDVDMNLSEAPTRLHGAGPNDQAGWSLDGVGDVNGDGFDDVVVGAHLNNAGGLEAGAAYLFYGPLPEGDIDLRQADAIFVGEKSGERAGHAVAGKCDINGDGFSDFLVASYLSRASGQVGGAVWVIYGSGL